MHCKMPEMLPEDDTLHIVTAINNPLLWHSRYALARGAIVDWLKEPNVHVTIVEVAHGDRKHCLCDLCMDERVTHIKVYAKTMAWSKENCINLGIQRLLAEAKYIGVFDADVHWRVPGWAGQIVHHLNLYPVVQPWQTAYDLGPNDEHIQAHISFGFVFHSGLPVLLKEIKKWNYFYVGKYGYPHPGYAWAWTRGALDGVGGLFELGGMGSGDHHMALALVGLVDRSIPDGCGAEYRQAVETWQMRSIRAVNYKVGYVPLTIEHKWHGDKKRRGYQTRWGIFIKHGFDPLVDLKRNTFGILEFDGNKPDLEREFDCYLRSRQEDANIIA